VIKVVLMGIWVCSVALGTSYFSAKSFQAENLSGEDRKSDQPVEYIKSDMISAPVIRTGKVQGYIVAQFTFAVDSTELAKLHFEPSPFLFDAAFRSLYEDQTTDFTKLKQQNLSNLVNDIILRAKTKIGGSVVKDVLLTQINYVARDEVRTNWVKK
jgi:flagellar basal body-associated protein FliL